MAVMVRVWDAPTRLFHWALVLCVLSLVVTAQIGGAAMPWHFRLGYGVLTLLLFRLVWGLVGGHWSRFGAFLYRPSQILRYLRGRGEPSQSVGHNPAGALSVVAMLGVLALQVASGLLSDDEIAAAGPLTSHVAASVVSTATFYHKEIGKVVLLALVALHLGAIAFYYFKRHDNLVKAMLTGDKALPFAARSASDNRADRLKAGLIALLCALTVAALLAWAA